MPVTYTNRKGRTYFLCQSHKSGRPWYYFAAEPKGEPVDQVPEGYEIRESVNGLVSLAKIHPLKIRPEELAAVEEAVARHPRAKNYRVEAKDDRFVVYERIGPDVEKLSFLFDSAGPKVARRVAELEESLNRNARFKGEMRFVLDDEDKRIFRPERWCYSGSIDDWIELRHRGPIKKLARELVPKLGTEAFFDLY